MMFRRKLLAVFALTVFLSVAAVTWLVSAATRSAFDKSEDERTAALLTQFRHEFDRQGESVTRQVEAIAASESVSRMAVALNRAAADAGPYFELAKTTAENNQLDFLEFVDSGGNIVSSAQWPERFGYHYEGFDNFAAASKLGPFLKQESLSDGSALGIFAVRATQKATQSEERPIYVIGGRRLDQRFLAGLDMPAGMRVLLYRNQGDHVAPYLLTDAVGSSSDKTRLADKLEPLIAGVRQSRAEQTSFVHWSANDAEDETFHAIPLLGQGAGHPVLAILLIGSSRRSYVGLMRHITSSALLAGGAGIVLAILLSTWTAMRVTRPVERLAQGAHELAAGNWNVVVPTEGEDELGQLAESFNRMTAQLQTQQERLVQAERVAAWRELARRLAHELKNPLFPLQLTVENLMRTKQQAPEQFDEEFVESSRTLLAEVANLKAIIGRFSEFSTMPRPQLQMVQMNDLIRGAMKLFHAQLEAPERARIESELHLDPNLQSVAVDPELLHRAIFNLILNAIEAMPEGGTLTLSTTDKTGITVIAVSDTGSGISAQDCERIFTPYYTSKNHGSGLGLAIVQSVVTDHGGRVHVKSEIGRGSTFSIELPCSSNTKSDS